MNRISESSCNKLTDLRLSLIRKNWGFLFIDTFWCFHLQRPKSGGLLLLSAVFGSALAVAHLRCATVAGHQTRQGCGGRNSNQVGKCKKAAIALNSYPLLTK